MSFDRSHLINPDRRLPRLSLPSWPHGDALPVQPSGRGSTAIVMVHGGECEACDAYIRQLEREMPALEEWDCRVRVIFPSPPTETERRGSQPGIRCLVDEDRRLARLLDLSHPAVVVVDQWRQIHHAGEGGDDHRFVSPAELVSWARSLAVQCPECEGEAL
jgi:hypothetical protein